MIQVTIIVWTLIALVVLPGPISVRASDNPTAVKQKRLSEESKPNKQIGMPVYKPPFRGAPAVRVGAGTRGADGSVWVLAALVPEHPGLTLHAQPVFYWYISRNTSHVIELTVVDDESYELLLEKRYTSPLQSGLHSLRLSEHGVHLSPGRMYKWFVALVLDPDHRSKDITAGGGVKRIHPTETLQKKLDHADKESIPNIFAEAGIWYDALSALSEMIDAAPDNAELRRKRALLIEQVGLPKIW
jgi:hypothetical protein